MVRWRVAPPQVTGSLDLDGHGTAVSAQVITTGGLIVRPADPTSTGFTFGGWFTDAALTHAADFSSPIVENTTLYASWSAVIIASPGPQLALTGADVNPLVVPLGIVVLALGGLLVSWSRRRTGNRRS